MSKEKKLGTFLPLSALKSTMHKNQNNGTISDGLLFIDWLHKNKQSFWQMLPLHQTRLTRTAKTKHMASPYQGYGIGLDPKYLVMIKKDSFKINHEWRLKNTSWLPDYALFCALRDHFGTDNWTLWEKPIRLREAHALALWKEKLEVKIEYYTTQQEQLHNEYHQLKAKAKEKNIQLVGDLAYYLPLESPLVWMYQHLFNITEDGMLPRVSGVVNEEKAIYGRQFWGHPLYRWDIPYFHADILALFKLRLNYLSSLFDMVRLDHANGIFLYGSLDPREEKNDKNMRGPGFPFFKQLIHFAKEIALPIFAEDASVDLKELRNAMHTLDVPGIRIFRYAYDDKNTHFEPDYANIPRYPKHSIAYTTTHDTETLVQWHTLTGMQKKHLAEKVGLDITNNDLQTPQTFAKALRQLVINSPSYIVIIPLQDWLFTTERINIPGTEKEENDPNWQYRIHVPVEDLPLVE